MITHFRKTSFVFRASLLIATLAMACVGLSGCRSGGPGAEKSAAEKGAAVLKKVGIMQLVEHPALDASRQGFIDGLTEAGFKEGVDVEFNTQNAQGDQSNLNTMIELLLQNQSDLILAIATPAALAVANATTTVPVMITAVTDPADALIVESNERPNCNVSGTSDMTPVKAQLDLMLEILPDVKTIGIYYSSSETNSELQAALAKEWADDHGIAYEMATATQTNDIAQVTENLVGKIDAIYIPTDNLLASSLPLVAKIATEKKVPLIVGEEGQVENGGLLTQGINYYNLGKITGQMAARVLKGEAKPESMPIQYVEETELVINKAVADELGIEIPPEILERAARVIE